MTRRIPTYGAPLAAAGLALLLALAGFAQDEGELFKFETTTRLVIVNVAVQDRNGNPIEGLTADDFRITEDNDRQEVSVFEYQRMADQTLDRLAPAQPRAVAWGRRSRQGIAG